MPDLARIAAQTNRGATEEEHALETAARYRDQARRAGRAHGEKLRGLEVVFGPAVRAAAEQHLEELTESSSEAIYFLEKALELSRQDRASLREELVHVRAVLTNTLAELDRALELPETMVERAERYFVHTRRARPAWLRDGARAVADARVVRRSSEEPF